MNEIQEQKAKEMILNAVQQERYTDALEELERYFEAGYPKDDTICIMAGSIFHYLNEKDLEWDAIANGLQYNPENAELYVMLGNYYLQYNLQQAYLCYENALFYADDEDKPSIDALLKNLVEQYNICVPRVAIVILSYNLLDYTRQCIESTRESVPETAREIIVVDNASTDGSVEWLREQKDIVFLENEENVGFPKGCNQGIALASENADIFLLNNDTFLPPNALFWLRMGLYQDEKNGAVGSVTNYAGNLQQITCGKESFTELLDLARKNNVPMKYPYEEKLYLIGFALLIKRSAMKQVGVLDERFTLGNFEDNDYGLRMLQAGYRNILCRNSFIVHFGSLSFGKLGSAYGEISIRNQAIINAKWGMQLEYYMHPRMELASLIKEEQDKAMNILDIGCGCGSLMAKIRGIYPNAVTYGVELMEQAAEIAAHMGTVICGDVEQMTFSYPDQFFDYCFMGDVLEHLREPQSVLLKLRRHIKPDGHIIVSMPNIKHWSVMVPLLRDDRFPYTDAGILDRTHLKMYTGYEMQRLITSSGYTINQMFYVMSGQPNKEEKELLDILVEATGADIQSFMAYQYIIMATIKNTDC